MVIVDECHHISAFSFEKVIKAAHAKYVYGLTATPKRQDGHHPIIFMHCGAIRYKVDALSQSKERSFEHMVLPRFTSFKMPPKIGGERWHIQKIYTAITESETRNQMIIQDVLKAVEEGRNSRPRRKEPRIFTERRNYDIFSRKHVPGIYSCRV